jgi:hypothetical protein
VREAGSGIDFSATYFMFTAKDGDYNKGNPGLDSQRNGIANRLIGKLDSLL